LHPILPPSELHDEKDSHLRLRSTDQAPQYEILLAVAHIKARLSLRLVANFRTDLSNRQLAGARSGKVWSCTVQNPVLNKIDASLTLTELSLLADKAVLHLVPLSSKSQSFTDLSGGSPTWQDSCTFVAAGLRGIGSI